MIIRTIQRRHAATGDDRAGHVVACHYTDQAERFRMLAAAPETWAQKPFAI
jgi:hypothetical protein